MKTVIEVDTEDTHEIKTACDILTGYLQKKKIPFQYISYTDFDDGRKMSVVKVKEE